MMKFDFAVIVLAFLVYDLEAKVFTRCGLAKELVENKFPRSFIGQWMCMIESESGRNTSQLTEKADRSKSVGLFQINDKKWCTWGSAGGNCKAKCEDYLNEDIRDDSICAKKIQNERGFRFWEGWVKNCYRQSLPDRLANTCLPPI